MEWRSIYLGDFSSNNIVVVFTDEDSVVSVTYSNTGKTFTDNIRSCRIMKGLAKMVWDFAEALKKHGNDGFKNVSISKYAERIGMCTKCP